MQKSLDKKLENVNKLIFVRRYSEAEEQLVTLIESRDGKTEMLLHLRRIELAAMLKKLDQVRSYYQAELSKGHPVAALALALTEQHGHMVSSAESIAQFGEILREYGPSAGAYYGIGYSMEEMGNYDRAILNYQKALEVDPGWHIAYFGLSQAHYQLGDDQKGDHFFYLFEQNAPYNVYGNFETHRRLYHEFLDEGRYAEAESAVHTLVEWWQENKGSCPIEVEVYEMFCHGRIKDLKGDTKGAEVDRMKAHGLAMGVLEQPQISENVLYFIAKILEENSEFQSAFRFYKRILKKEGGSPQMVQKIGGQFLGHGEYKLAKELFDEAYVAHPENPDIRFCQLVANLKIAQVNVEEYLIGRERLRQLVDHQGDRVELLALLHSLLAKFQADAEVHSQTADLYLKLGNLDRAEKHFDTMYKLDAKNRQAALKYAAFLMQHRDANRAMDLLKGLENTATLPEASQAEIYWLKASYHARKRDFRSSQDILGKVVALDPWNVSYLVQEIINRTFLSFAPEDIKVMDPVLLQVGSHDDSKIEWREFDQTTQKFEAAQAYDVAYVRHKLRYLYAHGDQNVLTSLVRVGGKFDASRATYDFMKLLNTNFDGPNIYWALGTLFKELWQLETATLWFEQMLLFPSLTSPDKARAYLELSDCFTWQNKNPAKAVEYAKLALDLDNKRDTRRMTVLAHAYLRSGQIRQAKAYLEQSADDADSELRFVRGLLAYRNGARQTANQIWKPLLTQRTDSLRFHHIKQEVLKYYFEGTPYLKAN